jgi:hypothetical protein
MESFLDEAHKLKFLLPTNQLFIHISIRLAIREISKEEFHKKYFLIQPFYKQPNQNHTISHYPKY